MNCPFRCTPGNRHQFVWSMRSNKHFMWEFCVNCGADRRTAKPDYEQVTFFEPTRDRRTNWTRSYRSMNALAFRTMSHAHFKTQEAR